jgi:hypothetical protein
VKYFDKVPTTASFEKLHPSSKNRFCRQANKVLTFILNKMAANDDVNVVWQSCMKRLEKKTIVNVGVDNNLRVVMTSLVEAYENASHWTVRRQILSIMAKDLPLSTITMFIPYLTA